MSRRYGDRDPQVEPQALGRYARGLGRGIEYRPLGASNHGLSGPASPGLFLWRRGEGMRTSRVGTTAATVMGGDGGVGGCQDITRHRFEAAHSVLDRDLEGIQGLQRRRYVR